jgi:two-component system, LytTR family, sensor kinase
LHFFRAVTLMQAMSAERRLNPRYVFAIWTGVGVLLVLQTYLVRVDTTQGWGWKEHMFTSMAQMYRAWLWAALTPLVFGLRRELARRHPARTVQVALHLLAALSVFAFGNVFRAWVLEISFGYGEARYLTLDYIYSVLGAYSLIDFYLYWIVLGAGYSLDLVWRQRQAELREERLRTQLVQAELAALRHQVQPHFLFNALNAIAALMREGRADSAVEALARLSGLLRQLMQQSGRPEIPLRRELDYTQGYLAVEKVRFEERLELRFEADEACLDALVPSLILQPLVENAVKHGIAQRRLPGRVTVAARRQGDRLQLMVANDPAENARPNPGHGIGLRATRERLERMYDGAHRLDCVLNGPEGTVVSLEIPFRTENPG